MRKILCMVCIALLCTGLWATGTAGAEHELVIGVLDWAHTSNPALEYAYLSQYPDGVLTYQLLTGETLREAPVDVVILDEQQLEQMARAQALQSMEPLLAETCWTTALMDVRGFCRVDGVVYALPRTLRQAQWQWNTLLAEGWGLPTLPMPCDWESFLSLQQPVRDCLQRDVYLFPGSDHLSGRLPNNMLDVVESLLDSYAPEEITQEAFERVTDAFVALYRSGLLCAPERAIENDNVQILCMPLATGAYVETKNVIPAGYCLPPCVDASAPRYAGIGTVYALPAGETSEAQRAFVDCLTSPEGQRYLDTPEGLFSRAPRYAGIGTVYALPAGETSEAQRAFVDCLTSPEGQRYLDTPEGLFSRIAPVQQVVSHRDAGLARLTAENLGDYELIGLPELQQDFCPESYAQFTFQREHAVRQQAYQRRELYGKLLELMEQAMQGADDTALYQQFLALLAEYHL